MCQLPEDLLNRIATTASGYAVVKDGVLDINTCSDTRNRAAQMGLIRANLPPIHCPDGGCDCNIKKLAEVLPETTLVTVKIEVDGLCFPPSSF